MKLNLSEIKAPHKKERDLKNLEPLMESMDTIGQIEDVVLNERNEIIAGRRRYFAAKKLGWTKIGIGYFDKSASAIDIELAQIDSNLMTLPLSSVDHDLALSRRKRLYEQKFPETRQYATGVAEKEKAAKPFTKDVADNLGITRRSVELAVSRAEKSSPKVIAARREGKLSPTIVNELVRLPPSYQDKLLSSIADKNVVQVRNLVDMALDRDINYAVARADKTGDKTSSIEKVEKNLDKLQESVENVLKRKIKCSPAEVKPLTVKLDGMITLLEKLIDQITPVHKPILRKGGEAVAH